MAQSGQRTWSNLKKKKKNVGRGVKKCVEVWEEVRKDVGRGVKGGMGMWGEVQRV